MQLSYKNFLFNEVLFENYFIITYKNLTKSYNGKHEYMVHAIAWINMGVIISRDIARAIRPIS